MLGESVMASFDSSSKGFPVGTTTLPRMIHCLCDDVFIYLVNVMDFWAWDSLGCLKESMFRAILTVVPHGRFVLKGYDRKSYLYVDTHLLFTCSTTVTLM